MCILTKALLLLPFSILCRADPLFVLMTESLSTPTPPPGVTGTKELSRWERSQFESISDAWESYISAHSTEHAMANAAILMHDATVTSKLPEWAKETWGAYVVVTETPKWFRELPAEVQSIKLAEGRAWASIVEDKSALAPKETAAAALGVLAGMAAAAAIL